ncbi:R2-like ligand-binding oxidase [Longimicrobium terrae]|nr:R2-like ligand-binding oxidase [Longimicrobium terrae]
MQQAGLHRHRTQGLLDRESFPMRLWSKAKRQGAWDPQDIDFAPDRMEWATLPEQRRQRVLQLCALFHAGEEAVTLDLLPLLRVLAAEGRMEEEMYLTSFLWEEAKHVDLFDRFFAEVAGDPGDLSRFWHPSYRRILDQELPDALRRLETDASPEAQVRASVTYNLVVEGIMADTGYLLFDRMLGHDGSLPGMRRAVGLLRRDESRHVAFGLYLISRLVVEHGDRAYGAFLRRMTELKPIVEDSTRQFLGFFDGAYPMGITMDELMRHSRDRFAGRLQRIVRARTRTLHQLRVPGHRRPQPATAD